MLLTLPLCTLFCSSATSFSPGFCRSPDFLESRNIGKFQLEVLCPIIPICISLAMRRRAAGKSFGEIGNCGLASGVVPSFKFRCTGLPWNVPISRGCAVNKFLWLYTKFLANWICLGSVLCTFISVSLICGTFFSPLYSIILSFSATSISVLRSLISGCPVWWDLKPILS